MKTELRQLVGKRLRGGGVEYVAFEIDQIMYDGCQIGQISRYEGASPIYLSSANPATFKEIAADIETIRGQSVGTNHVQARRAPTPEEIEENETGEGLEDE